MMSKVKYLFLALFMLAAQLSLFAQDLLTVSGIIRDDKTRLPFVSVAIEGSTLGTITNEDGYFSLKIPYTDKEITLLISHVGYHVNNLTVKATEAHEMRIFLKPYQNLLDAASIVGHDPKSLVQEALRRVRFNYPMAPVSQLGFYRETARKGSRYISVSEAVVDMFKFGYNRSSDYDRVEIVKGRMLVSQKRADTLAVKLQGGPVLALSLDVVKNTEDLFYTEDLGCYDYSMETQTVIDERPVHVVRMEPRDRNDQWPLYHAKVYIDKESLAIMRVEYDVDMDDPDLVTKNMLRKKPAGIRFEPRSVSFIASYRQLEGKTVLNYVRAQFEFKCDWKKRIFSSPYTVVSEMVATDTKTRDVIAIPASDSFKSKDFFYDKVNDFADPDYWKDYNILEPSESLEHAVGRLRRRAAR